MLGETYGDMETMSPRMSRRPGGAPGIPGRLAMGATTTSPIAAGNSGCWGIGRWLVLIAVGLTSLTMKNGGEKG